MDFLGKHSTSKYCPQSIGKHWQLECYEKAATKNDDMTLAPVAVIWKSVRKKKSLYMMKKKKITLYFLPYTLTISSFCRESRKVKKENGRLPRRALFSDESCTMIVLSISEGKKAFCTSLPCTLLSTCMCPRLFFCCGNNKGKWTMGTHGSLILSGRWPFQYNGSHKYREHDKPYTPRHQTDREVTKEAIEKTRTLQQLAGFTVKKIQAYFWGGSAACTLLGRGTQNEHKYYGNFRGACGTVQNWKLINVQYWRNLMNEFRDSNWRQMGGDRVDASVPATGVGLQVPRPLCLMPATVIIHIII